MKNSDLFAISATLATALAIGATGAAPRAAASMPNPTQVTLIPEVVASATVECAPINQPIGFVAKNAGYNGGQIVAGAGSGYGTVTVSTGGDGGPFGRTTQDHTKLSLNIETTNAGVETTPTTTIIGTMSLSSVYQDYAELQILSSGLSTSDTEKSIPCVTSMAIQLNVMNGTQSDGQIPLTGYVYLNLNGNQNTPIRVLF